MSVLPTSDTNGTDRQIFTLIILPRSLFESVGDTVLESRLVFTAYNDDVFFFVSTAFDITTGARRSSAVDGLSGRSIMVDPLS